MARKYNPDTKAFHLWSQEAKMNWIVSSQSQTRKQKKIAGCLGWPTHNVRRMQKGSCEQNTQIIPTSTVPYLRVPWYLYVRRKCDIYSTVRYTVPGTVQYEVCTTSRRRYVGTLPYRYRHSTVLYCSGSLLHHHCTGTGNLLPIKFRCRSLTKEATNQIIEKAVTVLKR